MEPLLHLDYEIDVEKLLETARSVRAEATTYGDSRYPDRKFDGWHIKHYNDEYIQKVMDDFGIKGKPRFMWLEPFEVIPRHIDNGTLCSLNFVLSENPAPITIEGKDYFYRAALLNTQAYHSVANNEHERVLFKVSIFDTSFEQLAKKLSLT